MKKTIRLSEFVQQTTAGSIDIVEHITKVLDQCKKINKTHHYFNTIAEDLALDLAAQAQKKKKGRLCGVPISVKDSICVKNVESTAGSRILKGYKPLFHATAVERLIAEGAIIIGKTSQDEFGFGGFSTNTGIGYHAPLNPFDKEHSTGGSSGGAAGITQKAPFPHAALGESTGGSIVNPASLCGVYGLAPTYGLISRYGLIDYGNSLDKIGPLARNPGDCALLLDIMRGHDQKDSTSLPTKPTASSLSFLTKPVKGLKLGIVKEAFGAGVAPVVAKHVDHALQKLEKEGCTVHDVSLPTAITYGIPTYYLIATSEASTNLAKFCGMRYGMHEPLAGNFEEYFTNVRSNHFGKEAKRRILLGTFARMAGYRDAYYIKALKVRTKIIEEYQRVFTKVDALVTPSVPILPPTFKAIKKLSLLQNYMIDILTVSPNLAGIPHLNVPVGFAKNLPIGMLLTANHLQEGVLFQLAKAFA